MEDNNLDNKPKTRWEWSFCRCGFGASRLGWGVFFLVLGVFFLLRELGYVPNVSIWPIFLIAFGAYLLGKNLRKK